MKDINWSFLVQKLLDTLMLSQGELAKLCNVSQQSVSNWKNGKREPEIYAKRKLLDIYQENSLSLYPSSTQIKSANPKEATSSLSVKESAGHYAAQEEPPIFPDYPKPSDSELNEFIDIFEKMPSSKKRELVEITKRKKAEEELKKSEQRYRLLAETSNDIISRMSLDNLQFLYISPACKALLGYNPEEVEGKKLYDLLDSRDEGAIKDFHRQIVGKTHHSLTVSYRMRTKNGKFIWVETSCNSVKLRRNRVLKEIVMVTRDIGKRKEVEDALKASEERFRLLAENSSDVITVHAMDSTLLYASPSCKQLLGYRPSEIIGENLWEKVHKDDLPLLNAKIFKAAPWRNAKRYSFRFRKKSGKFIWVETAFKYINGFINDYTEVLICIIRDITERKKVETALEYRENLLQASSAATNCLLSGKTENSILKAMKIIGGAAEADRVYIFENATKLSSLRPTMSLRYEWSACSKSKTNVDSPDLQNIPYSPKFSRWLRRFNAQKTIKGAVKTFPVSEKTFLAGRGVASVLLAPIYSGKKMWGFIGFDDYRQERKWNESEISILSTIGNALGASIRRMRMEESLRESETRFRIIADSAPVMMWMTDSKLKLKYSNKQSCEFIGKKLENSKNDSWRKHIHPDDFTKTCQAMETAFESKRKFKIEYRVRRKDGKYRWVLDYGLPRFLFDGVFAGYVGACVDITERKIMEEMLKGSEQKLQMSLDAASMGIWEWDAINNVLHCDKRIPALFGYPSKGLNLPLTELSQIVHNKDFSVLKSKLKKSLKTRALFELDIRVKAKSGVWKYAHLRGKPSSDRKNPKGKTEKLLGALHDISEQRTAEKILRETEDRYKELFNSMSSGVAVYAPSDDFKNFVFKDINKAGMKICKISSKNSLLGKNVTEAFPSVSEMGLFDIFKKVAKTGKTGRLQAAVYSDKNIFAWFENVVYRLPDGNIVAVFDDITEKKLFEDKLAKNERKYRTLLKSANDAIFILDADSKVVLECNTKALKILKARKKEIMGADVFKLHPTEEHEKLEDFLNRIEEEGFINQFECNVIDRRKNERHPVEISGNILELEGQKLIVEILRDVSERKKMDSMREDIDRIAKHDLKSPLNFIINMPEILKNDIKGLSKNQLKILQMIEDSARKMLNTINLSLEMYKIEHGNLKPDIDKIDICSIVEKIKDEQKGLLRDKSSNLKVIIEGDKKTDNGKFIVSADEFLCYSMLSNLIKNALERTPSGKDIIVRLSQKQKNAIIKIKNAGSVPDEIKDRFFDKYSSAGKQGGIGLGTYSAKIIALAHKGRINMASSDKHGTTITIELPLE